MGLPTKNDLAGATATKAQVRTAMGLMWEYLAGLLGSQTPSTPLTSNEKATARESLGVGANGFKNRFVNPTFSVSQEFDNASTAITAGASIKYVVDQWYASCTGTNISAQQIAGVGNQKYSLQLTGSAANTGALLGQRLESENVYDLKNKNCTVSFKAKSSVAKTVSWTVYTATVEDNFTSKTQIATGTINTTSTLTDFQFTFNAGANAGNGLAIEFSVSSLLNTETIAFDEMQSEKSSVATEFQSRPIQQELALCQRYWEYIFIQIANGSISSTGQALGLSHSYKITKKASPTITFANGTQTGFASGLPTIQNASENGFNAYKLSTSTSTLASWQAYLNVNARL